MISESELHDIAFHLLDKVFVEHSDKAEVPTILLNWKQFTDALLPAVVSGLKVAVLAEEKLQRHG